MRHLLWITTLCMGPFWAGIAQTPRLIAEIKTADFDAMESAMGAVETYSVNLNVNVLRSAPATLLLPLPDGREERLTLNSFDNPKSDRYTWTGTREDNPFDHFIASSRDGWVSALFYVDGVPYQIRPTANGHALDRLDHALFPECSGGVPVETPETAQGSTPPAETRGGDTGEIIDVMVVYTSQARSAAGGTSQMETVIQNAVDITNLAYNNSEINTQLRLVYMQELSYNDSGSLSSDLSWVRGNAEVGDLRDQYGADMVCLIVNSPGCGIGYVQTNPGPGFAGSAFQVTARGCAVGNLTFAHEFGHNQGCEHNPENSSRSPAQASYPWAYGHWHNGNYRTVMSYSNPCTGGCTRHPYVSNANITFQGELTGVADERENYRTINSTAPIIANFRQSICGGIESLFGGWPNGNDIRNFVAAVNGDCI